MTRVSLKANYDNKDVIQQIYDIRDQSNKAVQTAQAASDSAAQAMGRATAAEDLAQEAITQSEGFADDIQTAITESLRAQTEAEEATTASEGSIRDVSIEGTETTASIKGVTNNNIEKVSPVPLASELLTGMMTSQTYRGLMDAIVRIGLLEGKIGMTFVTLPSDDPTQEEITAAFTAKTSRAPLKGEYCKDIARTLTYQFDGSLWIGTTAAAEQWTNDSLGLIRGSASGDGTVFAESDGTASVNGWDDLNTRLETFINSAKTAFSAYSIEELADQVRVTFETLAGGSFMESIAAADGTRAGVLKASDWTMFSNKAERLRSSVVELTVGGWGAESKEISVAVDEVTADSIVWVSPADESFTDYYGNSVRCVSQTEGALVFRAETVPVSSLTVNVVIG